ncbi:Inter alpha-trypsin inhibitor, heavy chain 4 [Zea mays]|uniref:Inter alpha-trypsin inhibitor, heavy chain 4 n=1 Tax=Zea mays TaxID=4577 RepID=A0A317Y162_MAIZE|nr:Inter alpha-trypsin inhibitor, heavy chain 4 [Zea mays]
MDEAFARAVEDGLKLTKRLVLPSGGGMPPPPRPHLAMDRDDPAAALQQLMPAAPMAYAVVVDPAAVDSPDVPSYQPHVYGRLDPPALIPLQMREVELRVDCAAGCATAEVALRARWWLHCITRSRACHCRIVVPMAHQGSILGAEVTVGKRSYNTHVIDTEDNCSVKIAMPESGGLLKQEFFSLTIPQVGGGEDIFATIRWSQKLLYDNGQFSVEVPFRFPQFVNPLPKVFMKKEKIQLIVNSGVTKEILLQGTSHPLKEKSRQGEKLSFLHEAVVENWSTKDFTFAYTVYSGDLSGGVLVQPSTLRDYDDRDMFCLFLLPGNNENRKVFRKAVVYIIDTSGSMQGKPLESVKNALSTTLSDLIPGDYFNIITFNDELHSFSSHLEQVNEKTIGNAIEWMNLNFVAQGGTNIMHPLSEINFLIVFHNAGNNILGSYCNHYFLRMLASIGKGHYAAAFDTGSIEGRMLQWFQKASSTIVSNVSIDAIKHIQDFEVDSVYIPDISAKYPLCVSGRYNGKLPETLIAKGHLADMSEISIELKVQHIKDIPLDKVLAKQQMDLLTAKAWLMENKELERKVVKLSIQNSLPSEYTRMVLLQTSLDKIDPAQQAKNKPTKQSSSPDELPAMPLGGLAVGFGDVAATTENLTTGFGDMKAAEKFVMLEKAAGCCSRMADCCCCMCFIKACSKMNDQCAIVMAQACAAIACLGCFECCSELCCGGSN